MSSDPHAENQVQFQRDVNDVGVQEASKRWQYAPDYSSYFHSCVQPPQWDEKKRYRRDPAIPPLPSEKPTGHPHAALSGPELHRAIAEEIKRGGEWWRRFEWHGESSNSWLTPSSPHELLAACIAMVMRRKPRLVTITDASGNEHSFPEPMYKVPEKGTSFFYPSLIDGFNNATWVGSTAQISAMRAGLCQVTLEGAIAQASAAKALLQAISGGSVSNE